MKEPNYAPVYACMYPDLARICHEHGYALAVHGSVARDFDLIAVPWTDEVSEPQNVVNHITAVFSVKQVGLPEKKLHSRLVYTISLSYGECFLDLSFMPSIDPTAV